MGSLVIKKFVLFISLGAMLFASCQDYNYVGEISAEDEDALHNAALKLGIKVDATHDWATTNSGSIAITADADLDDIEKVQILTESPYFNTSARVLTEAPVNKGETVTLSYDAPKAYSRLIAACVSSKGIYYTKGFNVGENTLSFSNPAVTRSSAHRVESVTGIDVTKLKQEYKYSTQSYNAMRTILANNAAASNDSELISWVNTNNVNLWQGTKWEDERLWGDRRDGNEAVGGGWYFANNTVVREIDPITDEEVANLTDIFDNYLGRRKVNDKVQDNMESVRSSNVVTMYNNHLISTGESPVTFIPVQLASSEIRSCHLYYYYYDPSNIPSGMTEEEYLKKLPKFKAMQTWHTQNAAGIPRNGSETFFKKHEYLLPYYGDPNLFIDVEGKTHLMCTTDGNLYRLRNGQALNGENYYMTYLNATGNMSDKLATKYDDSDELIANQLWQIFKDPDGNVLLYNVGSQMYLCPNGYYTVMSNDVEKAKRNAYIMNQYDGYWRFWNNTSWDESQNSYTKCLGTDLSVKNSKRVSTDKRVSDKDRSKWYLEPYTGSQDITVKAEFEYGQVDFVKTAESDIIPAGYRIGFMLRKLLGDQSVTDNRIAAAVKNGCCYGDGRLNTEINQFPGHFSSTNKKYTMEIDDPRIAMFEANSKTYLTFEDGADCNFSDLIIEVNSGVESIAECQDVYGQVYTFCFEDREEGDYDLNDVVIKATRVNQTQVVYSLEAVGGTDELYLRNLHGKRLNENVELHDLFKTKNPINVSGTQTHLKPIQETINVDPSFTFQDVENQIYIYNATTGKEVRLSVAGEDPHAVMIPSDFNYPLESTCIKDAYPAFCNWAANREMNPDWYLTPEVETKVYTESAFEIEEDVDGEEK